MITELSVLENTFKQEEKQLVQIISPYLMALEKGSILDGYVLAKEKEELDSYMEHPESWIQTRHGPVVMKKLEVKDQPLWTAAVTWQEKIVGGERENEDYINITVYTVEFIKNGEGYSVGQISRSSSGSATELEKGFDRLMAVGRLNFISQDFQQLSS